MLKNKTIQCVKRMFIVMFKKYYIYKLFYSLIILKHLLHKNVFYKVIFSLL